MTHSTLHRRASAVLLALGVAHVVAALVLRPACVSIDEVTHAWMLSGFAKTRAWVVENGYEALRSVELESMAIRAVNGRLVSAYPYGLTLLALPLRPVLGLRALVVLNAGAFVGTVAICRAIARRVLGSQRAALAAAAIFALGTYAWDYALALWPHASATFFTTAAFHRALVASSVAERRRAALHATCAGACMGLAVTLRLDAVFMAAPLFVLAILHAPRPAVVASAAVAGMAPFVGLLAVTNHARYGSWAPFSYGPWEAGGSPTSGIAAYAPLALVAASVLGLLVAWRLVPRMRRLLLVAVALCTLGALVHAGARRVAAETLHGLAMLVLDLRHSDPSVVEPALLRTADGAMLYAGTLKKAWLQSLPFVPVAVLAPLLTRRAASRRSLLFAVLTAALCPVVVFARFRWHGGMCFNLRYFLPALPFVAILTAGALRALAPGAPARWHVLRHADVAALLAVLAYLAALLVVRPFASSIAVAERFYLDAPLVLAAVVALLGCAVLVAPRAGRVSRIASAAAFGGTLLALAFASMTAFTQDVPATRSVRAHNDAALALARSFVRPGTLLVVDRLDPFAPLADDDVVLADGTNDRFEDVPRIVGAAACAGRRAIAVVHTLGREAMARAAGDRLAIVDLAARGDLVVAALEPRERCARLSPVSPSGAR